jgi:ABC-type branched-subunit amino acid transport system substrate-binding protein
MVAPLTRIIIAFAGLAASSLTQAFAENSVGVILPMTGEFARYGERIRQGIEGKRSKSVKFVYEDEGCNPAKAVGAYHKLRAATGAELLLGPWCGSPQVAVAALLKKTNGLAVLGSSAPERVFELSGGQMLSVQPSIESESRFNAHEAFRLGARRVVIVFLENDFSRAHEAEFRAAFKGEVWI